MDCLVSSQVLINIFEHNTPLHDGAIIIRGDRIVSATCYLPLSDNMGISKGPGHQAPGCSGNERGKRRAGNRGVGGDGQSVRGTGRPVVAQYQPERI